MRKLFLLIIPILLTSLLMACESDTPALPSESKASAGNISSRSNSTETLPEGSQILLNARGGVTIENQVFTYTGGTWSDGNEHKWTEAGETTITALYPHDMTSLYEGDALKDILMAQTTLSQGETDVALTFKHLFASFILNVDETLVDMISEIQLTSPQKVASITSATGEITLSESANTTTLTGNGGDSYTFIIPPMQASLTLGITLSNGTSQTYTLENHLFESGFKYECKLRRPGIVNAEGLIEFCNIINGSITGDLLKYGEKQADGRMLYRLLADISLTEDDCKKLKPIGNDNHPFSDTFDGNGHTISKFIAYPYDGFAGFFGLIDIIGTIKNLHLSNCSTSTISNGADKGAGIMSGRCKGTITNCSISTSNITTSQSANTGGIAGTLIGGGTIINCSVTNSIFTSTTGPVGAIVGKIENEGYIYNSYSANNTIQNEANSTNARGGIAGSVNNGIIQNCYVYNLEFDSRSDNKGQITGRGINSTINYYYYDQDLKRVDNNSNCITTPNYKYNKSIVIYTLLNEWIETNQSSYAHPFTQWQSDDTGNLPAIFQ